MAHLGHAVPLNRPSPLAGKVSDLIINSGLATVQQSHPHLSLHPFSIPFLLLLHREHKSFKLLLVSVYLGWPFLTLRHSQKYHCSSM